MNEGTDGRVAGWMGSKWGMDRAGGGMHEQENELGNESLCEGAGNEYITGMRNEAHGIHVWSPLNRQGLYPAQLYLTPQISKHQLLASLYGAKEEREGLAEPRGMTEAKQML